MDKERYKKGSDSALQYEYRIKLENLERLERQKEKLEQELELIHKELGVRAESDDEDFTFYELRHLGNDEL